MYWIKRKITQIKNVIKWIPIIWNQFDFDYKYAIDVFIFKLERIALFLESNKAYSLDANKNANNIKRIIKLLNRVYNDFYYEQALKSFKNQYGEVYFDFVKIKGTNNSKLERTYENIKNLSYNELDKLYSEFINLSIKKQEKAEKLVWKLIGENIKYWWD